VDADFVNVFIAKQKMWIEELLAKHIILEARVQIAEGAIAEKLKEIEKLNADIEEKSQYINRLANSNNTRRSEEELILQDVREQAKQKKKKEDPAVSSDEF